MWRKLLTFCLLLPLLATTVHCRTKDACMLKWFLAAGINNASAVKYTGIIRVLGLDEDNAQSHPSSSLLPLLFSDASDDTMKFVACVGGTNKTCAKLAPCHNGGRCSLRSDTKAYDCQCAEGWKGHACREDRDECNEEGHNCSETARCQNIPGSYRCVCRAGFTGDGRTCEDIDECANSPCERNGTCHNLRNKFRCDCTAGTTGKTCNTDLNECASSPCLNGATCHDLVNRYRCQCPLHYEGSNCEHHWLKQGYFDRNQDKLLQRLINMEENLAKSLETIEHSQIKMQETMAKRLKNIEHSQEWSNDFHLGGCNLSSRYQEGTLSGGGWSLVWKHSYMQVPLSDLVNAKTYSSFCKPCTDLSDGWCNFPHKQIPGITEQMIVAYHKGVVVYAYKSPLNPNLGKSDHGARLMTGWAKVVDKCSRNNGVRPDISREGSHITFGIAFDKVTPGNININCDTVRVNYLECRWYDCGLPNSISALSRATQMTVAIFVR